MNKAIVAEHVASFTEKSGPLNFATVRKKLKPLSSHSKLPVISCSFHVTDDKYLEVRVANSKIPCEKFDLNYVVDIAAYSSEKSRSSFAHVLVFRYLAKEKNQGSDYNEFHLFKFENESDLRFASSGLQEEVTLIKKKRVNKRRQPRPRLHSRYSTDISELFSTNQEESTKEFIGRQYKVSSRAESLLKEVRRFKKGFKAALQHARSSGHSEISAKRRQDALPTSEATVQIVRKIREGVNSLADESVSMVDLKTADILNRIFVFLQWLRSIGETKKLHQIHPNIVRNVSRPVFTRKSILLLDSCLHTDQNAFWQSLGPTWTTIGFEISNEEKSISLKGASEDGRQLLDVESFHYYTPESHNILDLDVSESEFSENTSTILTVASKPLNTSLHPKVKIASNGNHELEKSGLANRSFLTTFSIQNFINSVHHRGRMIATIVKEHKERDLTELTVHVGDVLELLDRGEEWCCLRTPSAIAGHVPVSCIRILRDEDADSQQSSPVASSFVANRHEELKRIVADHGLVKKYMSNESLASKGSEVISNASPLRIASSFLSISIHDKTLLKSKEQSQDGKGFPGEYFEI